MRTLIALSVFFVAASAVGIREPDPKDWYQHATFYQIYPRSFKDSNGDGIGDLPGITSKLKYLADIGIDATWLSPPFPSPNMDFGYDVSDFYDIHPDYGTLENFKEMIEEAHSNGIKLMLDFIPNHSSDEHDWFIKSAARDPEYENFYTWHPGRAEGSVLSPPNNWISVFGGPAWTFHEGRKEYYLHQFTKKQPDLNYRNPKVLEEMTKMLFFWLDKGVDGFRLDAINHLFEDEDLRDEPLSGNGNPGEYDYLNHIYTKDVENVYQVVYDWRDQMDQYSAENNRTIILMTEAYSTIEGTMLYYESANRTRKGAHMPFNFQLIYDFKNGQNAVGLKASIDWWMNNMPARHTPSWVTGSHDHSRVATRVAANRVDQAITLVHMLPGTSITYYGEEIGMQDYKEAQQFDNRDPNRTPMQWDGTTSAGFSTNQSTWLKVHPGYETLNVKLQQESQSSTFYHYRNMTELRRHETLRDGDYLHRTVGTKVYALLRELRGQDSFLAVLNMADEADTVDLGDFVNLPEQLTVQAAQPQSAHKIGDVVSINNLKLGPYDSVVLRADIESVAASIRLSIGVLLIAVVGYFMQEAGKL
ncbi:alpha-glucosidase-like [Malaya genurostris]|uniref:alpha-glucosidase-like n=1 Tax=Malaya genurostris TaxID=325434 RepID=UPI0026F3B46A|nr:alpha-glucosidase-like [Malaya genurostris]